MKFSIIIPYYFKNDIFFNECLYSILNQQFQDYECIIVASKNELSYLDKYDLKNEKIKLYVSPAIDQSTKRNVGIDNAIGEYIVFLDNDDMYSSTFLTDSSQLLEMHPVDLVVFDMTREKEKLGEGLNNLTFFKTADELREELYADYCGRKHKLDVIYDSSCSKIFKKSIIDKHCLRYIDGLQCAEDAIFVKKYGLFAKNMIVSKDYNAYFWRYNKNSTMHDINSSFFNIEPFCYELFNVLKKLPNSYRSEYNKYVTGVFNSRLYYVLIEYVNEGYTAKEIVNHFKKNYANAKLTLSLVDKKYFESTMNLVIYRLIKRKLWFFIRIPLFLYKIKYKNY